MILVLLVSRHHCFGDAQRCCQLFLRQVAGNAKADEDLPDGAQVVDRGEVTRPNPLVPLGFLNPLQVE